MGNEKEIALIIASNINHFLDAHHLTRKELAAKVGVSLSSVGFWCNGTKIPRMDKVDRMCAIFECERSDILINPISTDDDHPLRPDESSLLRDYNALNPTGRREAAKRVNELTELDVYKKNIVLQSDMESA